MTIKRLILFVVLTPLAVVLAAWSLYGSLQEPQFQTSLELYQTNIVLQAQAWQPEDSNDDNSQALREAILGENPLESAAKKYEETRQSVQTNINKTKKQLAQLKSPETPAPSQPASKVTRAISASEKDSVKQLQQSFQQLRKFAGELDLKLGILEAQQGQTDKAIKTWQELEEKPEIQPEFAQTSAILAGMWSNPPRLFPNAQQLIQQNLSGWFRSTALIKLYQLQQRQDALSVIEAEQQEAATEAVFKLALITTVPSLTAFAGLILLIFLIAQRLLKGRESLLAQNGDIVWSTPWDVETILVVFVIGFFFMGQVFVPLLLLLLPIPHPIADVRLQAVSVLVTYLLVAAGALSILYLAIKRFFPLPKSWFNFRFRDSWFLWGFGGYCAALPIVIIVSLINQQLWQGQGGSNPLLEIALKSQDFVALGIFYVTAAIAAPIFEELLFRGFLLPSLTRYFPVWGAIVVSAVLFAVAHLSLSEILPLTALGIILGVVYTRSRNLLAPILLHSLWNSGTLLSLFILGGK